jgi:hypothetical protein
MPIKLRVCILLMGLAGLAGAQTDTTRNTCGSYSFEGDDVVFEFDLRTYEQALHSADSAAVDFADFPIVEIAKGGNLEEWTARGWRMERVDENRFRLRKKLPDFLDEIDPPSGFSTGELAYASPDSIPPDPATYHAARPGATAVTFELDGFTDAREVVLAGSFNDWNEKALRMLPTATGWVIDLPLMPGRHRYKFIVDGRWTTDPANRRVETDAQGKESSVIFVR